ncbi:MAG TPA: hypothetical protein VN636_09520 [Acidimicrobiia bacterium]|nr:hypothetical protein [Acidimicrobiia bacterium]
MHTARNVRTGIGIAAIAIGLFTAGCVRPVAPVSGGPPAPVASLQIKPSTAKFPSTPPPYWPMPIVPVTITNTGTVTVRSIVVHGVGVYSVPSNTCSSLAPGHSCTANIQFCPTSPNHYVNTLSVTGNNANNGASVHAAATLDGTAT